MLDYYPYDLLDSLDYEKIRALMILTGHKYRGETPTIDRIKSMAYMALEKVFMSSLDNVDCRFGGFQACKFKYEHTDHYCYSVVFYCEIGTNY